MLIGKRKYFDQESNEVILNVILVKWILEVNKYNYD